MKIRCIEHVDHFSKNEHTFWLEVNEVSKEFILMAKAIDGDNFIDSCFGICVICTEDGWFVCEDLPGYQLFYIDNDGDKHWLPYMLSAEEEHNAIEYCMNDLEE